MTSRTLVLRSLRHHWRRHMAVGLGVAAATAVLVGALAAGDSVRASLRHLALQRLGHVVYAMETGDHFFRAELAGDMSLSSPGSAVIPVLLLAASASSPTSAARINRVQILGVDPVFLPIDDAPSPGATSVRNMAALADNEAAISRNVAARLGLGPGDELILRIGRPNALPTDVPLTSDLDRTVSMRVKIQYVLDDRAFGRFSLQANPTPPFNIFLSATSLETALDLKGRANLLLALGHREGTIEWTEEEEPVSPGSKADLTAALARHLTLEDLEVELRPHPDTRSVDLLSRRVFIEPSLAAAALAASSNAQGSLTYFANELRAGDRTTPYSFVSAPGQPLVPADMKDDEILVNDWLAADLGVKPGDSVQMTYYVVGTSRRLDTQTSAFTVRAIVPITGPAGDRNLLPVLPGLSDVENCRDWDPGIPIDLKKVRKTDEEYWDQYRDTPKAFVTLAAAQRMWGNRFGNLTAIRYPAPADPTTIGKEILQRVSPADLGFVWRNVRQEALNAGAQGTDFGGLFIGLSFFILAAALMLSGLLFVFGVEQRAEETGTLLALGFTPRRVRCLLMAEGFVVAALASIVGAAGGLLYNRAVIRGLNTLWRDAVTSAPLQTTTVPATLATGMVISVLVALLAMWLAIRKQAATPVTELQKQTPPSATAGTRIPWSLIIGLLAGLGAGVTLVMTWREQGSRAAGAFFGAGALLLLAGLALENYALARLSTRSWRVSTAGLALRNVARKKGRSLTTMGLLACGIFVVVAVGVNRHDPTRDAHPRSSGTGGFALIAETSIPIAQDLNSLEGRRALGLDTNLMNGVSFVAFRVHDGDDASCLNLNRAQRPTLLGVNPQALATRQAFSFAGLSDTSLAAHPWSILEHGGGPGRFSAVADQTVIQWGLGLGVGQSLSYPTENGRDAKLVLAGGLANSIFQGKLLLSESSFVNMFPSESGYRFFLLDVPAGREAVVQQHLARALVDYGIELTPAPRRLAEFAAVENTYLAIFLALGGLGLVLGSVGLGVVVLRNVMERRRELGLLRAVGFSLRSIRTLVLIEHFVILLDGAFIGTLAALIAVIPALRASGAGAAWLPLGLLLAGIIANGLFWVVLATRTAVHGELVSALRNE